MAVKLELYRVFKEVAETGNISLAAKNLYISQSAVSQSIKQLETALQARLFARSPRGVSLTWEGQMLYQYVRSALRLLATGEDKLSQAQQLLLHPDHRRQRHCHQLFPDAIFGGLPPPAPGHSAEDCQRPQRQGAEHAEIRRCGHRLRLLPHGPRRAAYLVLLRHPLRLCGGQRLRL